MNHPASMTIKIIEKKKGKTEWIIKFADVIQININGEIPYF